MLLGWLGDGGPVTCPILLDVPEQVIYMRRAFHNHTDMIEQLSTQRLVLSQLGRRDLMQGQVVGPRTEIHIVRIGFPYDLHGQKPLIEGARPREIPHTQGQMS